MTKSFKRLLFSMVVLVQLLAVGFVVANYLFFTNTLANNPKWKTGKLDLELPGYDVGPFHHKLPALANNALNPAAWRGYNEVYLAEPLKWKELSLRFLPSDGSYLYVIFHRTSQTFSAIRFSYSPVFQPSLVSGKYTGEFTKQIPLSLSKIDGEGWQKVVLKKASSSSQTVDIFYEDELIATFDTDTSPEGSIGFRTGGKTMYIDDVVAKNDENKLIFVERFDHLENFGWIFLISMLFVACLDLAVWLRVRNKPSQLKNLIQLNFSLGSSIIIIGLMLVLIGPTMRGRYTNMHSGLNEFMSKIKPVDAIDTAWTQYQNARLFDEHLLVATDSSVTKIMFVGGSQTEGEGSFVKTDNMASQFGALIEQSPLGQRRKFRIINAGRTGKVAKELYFYFRTQWFKLQPDIVILNVSSNDQEYETGEDFREALEDFISLSKTQNFRLVFVAEANSIESKPKLQTHQTMKEVAAENKITFIDMNQYIIDHQNDGILWWDFVHFTTFGFKLVATHLFETLKSSL